MVSEDRGPKDTVGRPLWGPKCPFHRPRLWPMWMSYCSLQILLLSHLPTCHKAELVSWGDSPTCERKRLGSFDSQGVMGLTVQDVP